MPTLLIWIFPHRALDNAHVYWRLPRFGARLQVRCRSCFQDIVTAMLLVSGCEQDVDQVCGSCVVSPLTGDHEGHLLINQLSCTVFEVRASYCRRGHTVNYQLYVILQRNRDDAADPSPKCSNGDESEDILLGCCTLADWSTPTFQRCLLPPSLLWWWRQ
jgi:hypothetical protein